MEDIEIVASGFSVPNRIVSNEELTKIMDTSDAWISKRTGIKHRHISEGENTSDLATKTAENILEKANLDAGEVDLIIVATMSPDSLTPSTAAIVQGNIHADNAIAFDISVACSGFSYALSIARSMLLTSNLQRALVIGAEVLSKLIDWHDRSTAVLFGDGSGGILIKKSDQIHFLGQCLASYGNLSDKLTAGKLDLNANYTENTHTFSAFQMTGRDVYRFATHKVPESIIAACQNAKITPNRIDFFLLHQANYRIIEQVARKMNLSIDKFLVNIDEYGNTSAASEAILLSESIEKKIINKGDVIALSGFGGGLTVATVIIKL